MLATSGVTIDSWKPCGPTKSHCVTGSKASGGASWVQSPTASMSSTTLQLGGTVPVSPVEGSTSRSNFVPSSDEVGLVSAVSAEVTPGLVVSWWPPLVVPPSVPPLAVSPEVDPV